MYNTLNDDINHVKAEAIAAGYTSYQINDWAHQADVIVRHLGFRDAHDVRRVAFRFGRISNS